MGTATVQRYIDPSINPSPRLGYRHYSAPTNEPNAASPNSKVADLTTAGFTPVINSAYNTVGNSVTPFPTVYGYEESRVNPGTVSGAPSPAPEFDKGFFSPNSLNDPLEATRGYTVNITASALVDFVGNLNNGPYTAGPLTRGNQAESGYHLCGNPYPSPLDWNLMRANGRHTNVEDALYVFKSTDRYTGTYTSYVNGQSMNGRTNVLPLAQGFFVRTVAGQTGSVSFTNEERLITFNNTQFQRGTADTRPQLTLGLRNAAATARTQTVVYFESSATAGFDRAFDARYLNGFNGLLLATESATAEPLAINGLPALIGTDALLPLRLAMATTGTYALSVDNLTNLPTGYHVYLCDALTGTYTDLATATAPISFSLAANGAVGGRYALLFTTQARVLATAPAALAQLANVYPRANFRSVYMARPAQPHPQPLSTGEGSQKKTYTDLKTALIRPVALPRCCCPRPCGAARPPALAYSTTWAGWC